MIVEALIVVQIAVQRLTRSLRRRRTRRAIGRAVRRTLGLRVPAPRADTRNAEDGGRVRAAMLEILSSVVKKFCGFIVSPFVALVETARLIAVQLPITVAHLHKHQHPHRGLHTNANNTEEQANLFSMIGNSAWKRTIAAYAGQRDSPSTTRICSSDTSYGCTCQEGKTIKIINTTMNTLHV